MIPQVGNLEDRLDRLVMDLGDLKRVQQTQQQRKVDREEVQLLSMRLSVFEKFDPKQFATQLETLTGDLQHAASRLDQQEEQIRRLDGTSAHRADLTKVRAELVASKGEMQKLQGEIKELNTTLFQSNRQVTSLAMDAKNMIEKGVQRLELEKVAVTEFIVLKERLYRLETSMRDNRQILSDPGGQELSAIVKRIILNMEDKIMILEKKVDCIADGRPLAGFDEDSTRPQTMQSVPGANDAAVQGFATELATMVDAMAQLKQDVSISRVNMDQILEQSHQSVELAHKLTVVVDGSGGPDDSGTALSLNRVQVMVAAAARQLVAGSKWVTKDMFDSRVTEIRKEFMGNLRQIQALAEEAQFGPKVPVLNIPTNAGGGGLGGSPVAKLPAVIGATSDKVGTAMPKRGPPGDTTDPTEWARRAGAMAPAKDRMAVSAPNTKWATAAAPPPPAPTREHRIPGTAR